jgi:AmiR/NasT family two-component response regulator
VTDAPPDEELAVLRAKLEEIEAENRNLRIGLSSRILVEQAKGVLIERLDVPAENVFELLRCASRRSRREIHELATEILKSRVTPEYIDHEIEHLKRRDAGPA